MRKVLVIDPTESDSKPYEILIHNMFKDSKVIHCADELEAIEKLTNEKFHLIITELFPFGKPDYSEWIKKLNTIAHEEEGASIIVCTANTQAMDDEELKKSFICYFKPAQVSQLSQSIYFLLAKYEVSGNG